MASSLVTAMAVAAGGKVASETVSSLLHGSKTTRDTIKERLDPVTLLAVVALMKFQLPDSKIHIGDHNVTISHSSEYTYLFNMRGVVRTYSGDSHEDLALIKSAIKTVAFWHSLHIEENTEIREFMDHVAEGLDALMQTYAAKYPTTCDALEFYKVQIALHKTQAPNEVVELNEVTTKVRDLWDKKQIGQLNSELRDMNAKQGTTPVTTKILCQDDIVLYLAKLQAKSEILKRIYTSF